MPSTVVGVLSDAIAMTIVMRVHCYDMGMASLIAVVMVMTMTIVAIITWITSIIGMVMIILLFGFNWLLIADNAANIRV